MYTLKFVNEQTEKYGEGLNETVATVTMYENDYYRLIKDQRTMTNKGYDFTRYEVQAAKDGLKMPCIYIKNKSWITDKDDVYSVEVGTSSFSGYDLDFVENYAHNLVKAVKTAREIEKFIEKDKGVK